MTQRKTRKFAEYEDLLNSIQPCSMSKRPKYLNGIGIFRGKSGDTVYIKFHLPHGGYIKGKKFSVGSKVELKLGSLSSFSWQDIDDILRDYRGRADRNELVQEIIIPTFKKYAYQWLEIMKPSFAKGCYQKTRNVINKDLLPMFGQKLLNEITVTDILVWRSKLSSNLKASTVKRYENDFKAILNMALKDGLIKDNPFAKVNGLKVKEPLKRWINQDELKQILYHAPKVRDWLQDYILWAVISGMRKGEIRNMAWSNIHGLDSDTPYVSITTGKTFKTRHIACSPVMVNALKRQRDRNTSDKTKVFPYADCTVRRAWDQLREITSITDITVQNLRTTSSTYAASSGEVSARSVASRNGHSLDVMERHYAGFMSSENAKVSLAVERKVHEVLNSTSFGGNSC